MDEHEAEIIAESIRAQAELLDIPGQAVIGTTLEGMIVYWNDAAVNLYGWSQREVMGRDVVTITPAAASRETAREIMRELAAGRTWTGTFPVRHRDGYELNAHVRDVPVRNADGKLIGVVGVSVPILIGSRNSSRDAQDQAEDR